MKKNISEILSTAFYGAGLILFLLTIVMFANEKAKAAPTAYNMTYSVNSWRNVQGYSDATHYTGWLTIGPAGWRITCNSGANCNYLSETWTASGFNDGTTIDGCGDIYFRFNTTSYQNPTNSTWGTGGWGSNNFNWTLMGSGLYGAFVMETQGWSNVYKCQWKATHSWPTSWSVSGTVGN